MADRAKAIAINKRNRQAKIDELLNQKLNQDQSLSSDQTTSSQDNNLTYQDILSNQNYILPDINAARAQINSQLLPLDIQQMETEMEQEMEQ